MPDGLGRVGNPVDHLVRHVRWQAGACARLGSPLSATLLEHVATDLVDGGPSLAILGDYSGDPQADALALRLLGGLHRLVLEGAAPRLAAHYPSVGGSAGVDGLWPAAREVLESHQHALRAGLALAPQTNEVGRAAALIGGLLHVVAATGLPVRLVEIGASAGLNLRADHFRVELPAGDGVGPVDSPVVLRAAWQGPLPPRGGLEVLERLGCDVAPVDPTTRDGRLRLMSYVWTDQTERLARLRGALALAAEVPAYVERAGAGHFLDRLELREGAVTVLWHSVTWQYLPVVEQQRVSRRIAELAEGATPARPFAHLAFEPDAPVDQPYGFELSLRAFPGGARRVLATPAPHGIPTIWR